MAFDLLLIKGYYLIYLDIESSFLFQIVTLILIFREMNFTYGWLFKIITTVGQNKAHG